MRFTNYTFKYLDQAEKNYLNPDWFAQNEQMYIENVKAPMTFMIDLMDLRLGDYVSGIRFSHRSLTNPKVPKNKQLDQGFVKDYSRFYLSDKNSSLYESHPGIFFQLGSKARGSYSGAGLYELSSRQRTAYRENILFDYKKVREMLLSKEFVKSWGVIKGETYKRFPKDYSPRHPAAEFLWLKQFYFNKTPLRHSVIKKNFINDFVSDLENGIEVFQWIRETVTTKESYLWMQ
jgi:uncharacterized protein (DUF2461 family)